MDYSEYQNMLDKRDTLQKQMAHNLRTNINANLSKLKEMYSDHEELILEANESFSNGGYMNGAFAVFSSNYLKNYNLGESNGIVFLDIDTGELKFDYVTHEEKMRNEQIAEDIGEPVPSFPKSTIIHNDVLETIISEDNNYKTAMFMTDPNALLKAGLSKLSADVNRMENAVSEHKNV